MSNKQKIRSILFIISTYSNLVFSNTQMDVPIYSTSNQLTAEARANPPNWKVFGGTECNIQDYAFVVSVRESKNDKHICGGSLISYNWVLSSAYCLRQYKDPAEVTLVLGYSSKNNSKPQRIKAERIIPHSAFEAEFSRRDIALVELERRASDDGFVISLVRLPNRAYRDDLTNVCKNNTFMIAGWGATHYMNISAPSSVAKMSKDLMCAELPYINNAMCKKYDSTIPNSVICTRGMEKFMAGDCPGDSGAPLFCEDVQFGIATVGIGCGVPKIPSFFTRVDIYLDFIYQHLRKTSRRSCGWFNRTNAKLLLIIFIVILL